MNLPFDEGFLIVDEETDNNNYRKFEDEENLVDPEDLLKRSDEL